MGQAGVEPRSAHFSFRKDFNIPSSGALQGFSISAALAGSGRQRFSGGLSGWEETGSATRRAARAALWVSGEPWSLDLKKTSMLLCLKADFLFSLCVLGGLLHSILSPSHSTSAPGPLAMPSKLGSARKTLCRTFPLPTHSARAPTRPLHRMSLFPRKTACFHRWNLGSSSFCSLLPLKFTHNPRPTCSVIFFWNPGVYAGPQLTCCLVLLPRTRAEPSNFRWGGEGRRPVA